MARKNKSKKDIVSDLQLVQSAERRRSLIRDELFPYLLRMDENISYTKVFLQSFSAIVGGVFDDQRKTTTLAHLAPQIEKKLKQLLSKDPKEYARYNDLVTLLKDVSIEDLAYATELARFMDGYIIKTTGQNHISTIDINKILG